MNHLVGIAVWLLLAGASVHAGDAPAQAAMDRAFNRMYNFDFAGVHAILDDEVRRHPDNPLIYSVRAAAILFSEFNRLSILESEFLADDEKITDKKRLKPDPAARAELFKALEEARKRSAARLAVQPQDRDAMFALSMATGIETDYVSLVEKKYLRTYSLSKEAQGYARKLLALNPPCYDAYMTLGTAEYVVGNLNFFFRLFVHFEQIEGSKQKAVENLKKVIEKGWYYPPFAKILLSIIYLREKQPQQALGLMKEMARDFPENPLVKNEVKRISEKISRLRK